MNADPDVRSLLIGTCDCGREFPRTKPNRLYCSTRCLKRAARRKAIQRDAAELEARHETVVLKGFNFIKNPTPEGLDAHEMLLRTGQANDHVSLFVHPPKEWTPKNPLTFWNFVPHTEEIPVDHWVMA